jgi:hypothetical protein
MKLINLILALAIGAVLAPAQTQTKLAPDCSASFQLSAIGTAAQFDNRTVSSATGVPCRYWTISYYVDGFSGVSLVVQSAQDNNGVPGSWSTFGGTVVNGINPNTATTSATTDLNGYFPWMRVNLTSVTGSGALRGVLNGYRTTGTTIAGGGGMGSSGYNQIQNNMVDVTKRQILNFVNGGCVDDAGNLSTDCTFSSGPVAEPGATFFSAVGQAGPSNSAAETSVIGTVVGSQTIPANTFVNGQVVQLAADGFYSVTSTTNTLTLKAKCGSTVLATVTVTLNLTSQTNGAWIYNLNLTAIGTGAGGAFITNGLTIFGAQPGATNTAPKTMGSASNTSNVAYDFTTSCAFDVTATWGSAVSGDLITGTNVALWIPGAPVSSVNGQTGAVVVTPFIQPLTAPVAGNFTQQNYNTGAGVVTTQVNNSSPVTSISLKQTDPEQTKNIVALDKAKLAATFTITEAISMSPGGTSAEAGMYLSDGGSPPNFIIFGIQLGPLGSTFSGTGLVDFLCTNFTTVSAVIFNASPPQGFGPLLWLRVQETVSARIYSLSSDGINFAQIDSESNTAHFTTARYGFAIGAQVGSAGTPDSLVTLYSFAETNP